MSRMERSTPARRVRRQFTAAFPEGAVRLVLDAGQSVGAVARELDLTASALAAWVQQARAERTKGKSGLRKEEREELVRLRTETRILAEARDILTTPRRSSPSRAGEVSVHCGGQRPPHGHDPMPVSRGQREWVLLVASPPGVHSRP